VKHLPPEDFFIGLTDKASKTRSPVSATFELTYGCNLRCVHCYNPTHRALPHELSTEEIRSILDQVADLGVMTLTFTGGELFVRPDVFDIFRHAKGLGFVLQLMSNATRITPAVAASLQELGFDEILLSIYGATKAVYERVTHVPGSYEPFIRGLDSLAALSLSVVVRMPVMSDNVEEVRQARMLIQGYGFKFQYCSSIDPRSDGDLSPLQHRLSPEAKVRLDDTMMGPMTANAEDKDRTQETCGATEDFISCRCGRSSFAITPYGEMNLCVAFPMPKYDLRKGTVKDGWEVLKQTVDRAQPNANDECPTCDVRSRCRQGRADAWLETGDMSVCLPHFKELAVLEQRLADCLHESLTPRPAARSAD
jgi:radical SAM protein with 4Fe4S-binding SPASM domain